MSGSIVVAQRVKHVWHKVYGAKGSMSASLHAFAWSFLIDDCSMWPLDIGAGNTHAESACDPCRISITAAARCGNGITLRAWSVLPCEIQSDASPICYQRSRYDSLARSAHSTRIVVRSWSR